jgi:hypothetical protein
MAYCKWLLGGSRWVWPPGPAARHVGFLGLKEEGRPRRAVGRLVIQVTPEPAIVRDLVVGRKALDFRVRARPVTVTTVDLALSAEDGELRDETSIDDDLARPSSAAMTCPRPPSATEEIEPLDCRSGLDRRSSRWVRQRANAIAFEAMGSPSRASRSRRSAFLPGSRFSCQTPRRSERPRPGCEAVRMMLHWGGLIEANTLRPCAELAR